MTPLKAATSLLRGRARRGRERTRAFAYEPRARVFVHRAMPQPPGAVLLDGRAAPPPPPPAPATAAPS